jgi:hypothetical protein
MSKLKIIEIVVLAATALLAAVKAIIKFIGYYGKLRKSKNKTCLA